MDCWTYGSNVKVELVNNDIQLKASGKTVKQAASKIGSLLLKDHNKKNDSKDNITLEFSVVATNLQPKLKFNYQFSRVKLDEPIFVGDVAFNFRNNLKLIDYETVKAQAG